MGCRMIEANVLYHSLLFMAVFEIDAVFRIFGPGYRDVDDSEKCFRFFECHDSQPPQ